MWDMVKKYWDLFGGVAGGLVLACIARFKLDTVQLLYSIIILMLVSVGLLKIIKQAIEKQREKKKERKHHVIEDMADNQVALKAVSLAQEPTKEGEKIGKIVIELWEVIKNIMNKFREFFSKFKGYMLTIALAVLTVVEMCGGFINQLCGGVLVVEGVEVLPLVTLACTAIVGILSNGYTKEQREKIKALFSKSSTNELVLAEIKKSLKENTAKLAEFNKILSTKQTELENLQSEYESKKNTRDAKKEMYTMVPQLATAEDVQLAENEVVNTSAKIADKTKEIADTQATIKNLQTTIAALKSQL